MATTQMPTGNALAVKLWAKSGWTNIGQATAFGYAFSRGSVYFPEELMGQRAKGDQLTYDYTNKLTGVPIGEGGTLDGNEEGLNLGSATVAMNVMRVGVMSPNEDTIEQQRTYVNFAKKANELIPNRFGELIDTSFFYQAAGANPNSFTLNGTTWSGTNKTFVQGLNPVIAPTANRIIRQNAQPNDQSLTSADRMTLDMIDYALEKNANSDQPLERLNDGNYDLYISPEQYVDLKLDTSGRIQWFNIQLAALTGGKSNTLSNAYGNRKGLRVLGTYGNVNLIEAPRVAYGVNSGTSAVITSVRRAVLMGKDAMVFASPFGGRAEDDDVPIRMKDQLKDYSYYRGIEGRFIGGLKKNSPTNGEDIGTIVLATYAAPHA